MLKRYKIIMSDSHLSAGRYFQGRLNPHEDFLYDQAFSAFLKYFSSGIYEKDAQGNPVEVELILGGDFLDFLNVPSEEGFEEHVTEEVSLKKLHIIYKGHVEVFEALTRFCSLPGKKVTYLMGNHDADLLFPKVREALIDLLDPTGHLREEKLHVWTQKLALTYPDIGLEIQHGHQFEVANELDYQNPFEIREDGKKFLKLPWGSVYVLKIVNRLKWEREYLDRVRPVKIFTILSFFIQPLFTIRYLFLSMYYFLRTRVFGARKERLSVSKLWAILKQEARVFHDLEQEARELLDQKPRIQTVVFGHTHTPMDRFYPDQKQYINSGTWTRMVYLDFRSLGKTCVRPFVLVQIEGKTMRCELRQWLGPHQEHVSFFS